MKTSLSLIYILASWHLFKYSFGNSGYQLYVLVSALMDGNHIYQHKYVQVKNKFISWQNKKINHAHLTLGKGNMGYNGTLTLCRKIPNSICREYDFWKSYTEDNIRRK